MFCPKCGSVLFPKKDKGKKVLKCSCGYSDKTMEAPQFKEQLIENEEVPVVEKEIETLPEIDAECPKCDSKTAYYWTQQTRSSDEPETKFFKCKKCKHTWRDYS